jgi:hypothetical protein
MEHLTTTTMLLLSGAYTEAKAKTPLQWKGILRLAGIVPIFRLVASIAKLVSGEKVGRWLKIIISWEKISRRRCSNC